MNNLKKAIYGNFVPGLTLYYSIADIKADGTREDPPYVVYQIITDSSLDGFSDEISDIEVQFTAFSRTDSSFECDDMAEQIQDYYRENQIPLEICAAPLTYKDIKLNRGISVGTLLNGDIWQSTRSFEVII